ncbi:hypothetical protein [Sporosarcina sp. Te-1]|uniref:hypothetical protein n=1 Tax=Sporosarcina sp. Te-1 TaxID=2818390 RepID=UPI001A9E7AC2|nr:hypothetical protein [Sporosarcina sp. Te-1]QTD43210.1 hypothetical protein J3U78_10920 [Sporosarcina sp. Te-1]
MGTISTKETKLVEGSGCLLSLFAIGFFIFALFNGFGFKGFILSVIVFIIGFGLLGQSQIMVERNKEQQKERLLALDAGQANLEKYPSLVSSDILKRIALNLEQQRIYVWLAIDENGRILQKPKNGMSYRLLTYSFADLLAVAMVQDRSIVLSSSKTGEDAALHRFIQERPVGAPASNANAIPKDKVRSMALILQMADEKVPFYQFNFYNEPYINLAKDSTDYRAFLDEMHIWHEKLKICMNQAAPNSSNKIMEAPMGNPVAERTNKPETEKVAQEQKTEWLRKADTRDAAMIAETHQRESEEGLSEQKAGLPETATKMERAKTERAKNVEKAPSEQNTDLQETVIPLKMQDAFPSVPEKEVEKEDGRELSYFERMVAENRRQLRERPDKTK